MTPRAVIWCGVVVSALLSACNDFTVIQEESQATEALSAVEMSRFVPTFQLQVDADEFADMTTRFEEDIEISCQVSMLRDETTVLANLPAEIQVKGNFSAGFPLKPLGVKLDRTVDNPSGQVFQVPNVLPGQSLSRIKSFRFRNGGNDFTGTLLKDLGYARVVAASGMDVVAVYGEPAACYVNDDFYGLLNLRSEGNANGLSRLLGLDKDDLALAELDEAPMFDVKEGSVQRFRDFERLIREQRLEELRPLVDESSFIDFVIIGTVFAAWDWPWKNVRLYSVDGAPFRFVIYDFDLASERHLDEGLLFHMRNREPNLISDLFEVLYTDSGFRQNLSQRYAEVMSSEVLHPRRLEAAYEELAATYEPVISMQTAAYGYPAGRSIWYLKLAEYIEAYRERYKHLEALNDVE